MVYLPKKISQVQGLIILSILILLSCTYGCTKEDRVEETDQDKSDLSLEKKTTDTAAGPLNAAYIVGGEEIRLDNGKASYPAAPGSAAMVRTGIFGDVQYGDLNNDGLDDAALFLQHDPGGTGTFFYVAAALYDDKNWQGTQAALFGDRIIPESIEISSGLIIIHYLGRKPGDPFGTPPSVKMRKVMVLEGSTLKEYSSDAEN